MPALFVALITPFTTPTGPVDLDAIPPHLRWLEANGVDGVVPCGTTGEGPSLSLDERRAVIETVLRHRGNLRVIAGTGCANLPETITATRFALERGAEAAMVLPPFFFKNLPDAGLLAYYRAVCDALPPGGKLMLYHIPPISQVPISREVIGGLLQSHPEAVYGLKDSGGDDDHTAMLIGHFPELQVYDGSAPLLANCLVDGAAGGIFALANVFPREMRAIFDAFSSGGDTGVAQAHVAALDQALKPVTIPAIKALLPYLAGLPAASVRAPLANLSPDEAEALWTRVRHLRATRPNV
jgi:4-hydroxy-tetrahydrodipicolinate synthase